jgi:hypothetical protein
MRPKVLDMQRSLSMRRLSVVTLIVFVLVLAFLAGRVRAGSDPAQANAPVSSSQSQPDGQPTTPYGGGSVDPYGASPGGGGVIPSPYGGDGSAVPNNGGSAVPDTNPPVTHAS